MAEVVRMPKMSDTMSEGVIAKWHKKVGDTIKTGELFAEIETDKATMDYESYNNGVVLHLGAAEGQAVKINDILAIVGKTGEDISALLSGSPAAPTTAPATTPVAAPVAASPAVNTSGIKAEVVPMPKMSDTMTEGVIAAWHKKVGDTVKRGELLAEIETDKATMEYESYHAGTLLYIGAEAKQAVPINGILAVIGEPGADWQTLVKAYGAAPAKAAAAPAAATPEAPAVPAVAQAHATVQSTGNGRVKASPLAKRIAREKGIDLAAIPGSGDQGRITRKDVEGFKPSATAPAKETKASAPVVLPQVVGKESFDEVPVSQMRKTIARRLAESKFSAPHFYLTMEINMDKAIEARKSMNEFAQVKISFNDMVIRAVAAALRQHPDVNVSWLGDKIRRNHHVHIGVAVAVKDGLVVPVVRFADSKSLTHISAEVKDLAQRAHDKKLQPADWEGSTFTISNLGMFGIEEFTAIINPPDACILAVGGIKETPVVKNGQIVPGNVMKVTLSCDHRAVDGAVGSAFLKTLKGYLEDPVRILI
jgi:pyruvate dehydrogenase E2 component (dihydrolipoamide acetyltransferase)